MQWNAATFCMQYLLRSIFSLSAAWELPWTILQANNTTLNASGTKYLSVLSKLDHCFRKICDWRVMDAMKCYNIFYIIPIGEYFVIVSCMRIDLNYLTREQHYIKCHWNSVCLAVLSTLNHFFLNVCGRRVMDEPKCNNLLYIPILE